MSVQVENLEKNMAKLTIEVPAEEFEAWGDGYPLVETIMLTLYLSKLSFLQSFTQMLLMAKLTDFVLYSVHWLILHTFELSLPECSQRPLA